MISTRVLYSSRYTRKEEDLRTWEVYSTRPETTPPSDKERRNIFYMLSAVGVRAAGKQLSWHKRTQSAGWCPGRLCRAWLQECCHLLPADLSTHQETFISVTPNFTLGFLSVATRARSLPRSLAIPFHQDGAQVSLLSPFRSNMALVLRSGVRTYEKTEMFTLSCKVDWCAVVSRVISFVTALPFTHQ